VEETEEKGEERRVFEIGSQDILMGQESLLVFDT
jgi:hypothetical protein